MKSLSAQQLLLLRVFVFVLAALPFCRLVFAVYYDQLGANPLEFITRNTGDWTLYFLCITLAITPLRKWLGWHWLIRLRRMLGLWGFFYAALHFLTFLWFDHFFDLGDMFRDVVKRPFIMVGFIAFVLLLPLAMTSTNGMIRRMGGKQWQMLHRLIYFILPLGVLHYFWMKAGKNLVLQPLLFALLVTLLLGVRLRWHWQSKMLQKDH